jgi:hypothetical protein
VLRALAAALGAVVISVKVRWKRCSHVGLRYLSLWQRRVRRWERRGPHAEWSGSVVSLVLR